ncbi:MAG: cobalamin biosynthesis protein CbiD [Bacteroides sp.]|nr:cobalamin biosynthesis protein CbiD [Bacteroides sp.]
MILIFGGTTEGRLAVKTLDEGQGNYFYSTRSDLQKVECVHGKHITGSMTKEIMTEFCRSNHIRLIIDAAHPFASILHDTIGKVGMELKIPIVRFERRYPQMQYEKMVMCDSFEEAIERIKYEDVKRLLALTGVQTIERLKPYWESHETYFRILHREESYNKAFRYNFPANQLVVFTDNTTTALLKIISPDAILTKESGESGGFIEKIEAARQAGIKVFVVRRPKLPSDFIIVDGCHGMRREVERIIPDFYPLHTGFTTGSCATAAAKAALIALLSGKKIDKVKFKIPDGETLTMHIENIILAENSAMASVIKDAGDDPDVTNKSLISATVSFASHHGIEIYGGEGIGTVTLPGLGLSVGEAAINPVPRSMIISELGALYSEGLDVTISLKDGEVIAEKTFNPKVGIIGGVSIIGTTGIVRPLSHEAFLESIRREIEVAMAISCKMIVVNSGGKSERFIKGLFPDLPPQAFVHYGNAVGEIMRIAEECGVKRLIIGLMLGKAVKLAEGNMDTHSHRVTINKEFLKSVAKQNRCSGSTLKVIETLSFARELPTLLPQEDADHFFQALLKLCHSHCANIFTGELNAVLIADDGKILCKSWS